MKQSVGGWATWMALLGAALLGCGAPAVRSETASVQEVAQAPAEEPPQEDSAAVAPPSEESVVLFQGRPLCDQAHEAWRPQEPTRESADGAETLSLASDTGALPLHPDEILRVGEALALALGSEERPVRFVPDALPHVPDACRTALRPERVTDWYATLLAAESQGYITITRQGQRAPVSLGTLRNPHRVDSWTDAAARLRRHPDGRIGLGASLGTPVRVMSRSGSPRHVDAARQRVEAVAAECDLVGNYSVVLSLAQDGALARASVAPLRSRVMGMRGLRCLETGLAGGTDGARETARVHLLVAGSSERESIDASDPNPPRLTMGYHTPLSHCALGQPLTVCVGVRADGSVEAFDAVRRVEAGTEPSEPTDPDAPAMSDAQRACIATALAEHDVVCTGEARAFVVGI